MRFAGTPPPSYVLDELFASLQPLVTRLSEVWVAVSTANLDSSVKSAMLGQLTLASQQLQDASIEGARGQRLAMGDITVTQWAAAPETAADLVEYIAKEVGISSYSIARLWREVVVPTVEELGEKGTQALKLVGDWGPLALLGAAALYVWLQVGPRRGLSGVPRRSRRRRMR